MHPIRQTLLGLYEAVTARSRRRVVRRLAEEGRAPIAVLFYHRVADEHPNPWTIGVEAFRRQVDWLRERFDVVSLREAQRRLAEGVSRRPAVAITFDDGYADNCATAAPLLLSRGVPFTYFVTTNVARDQSAFPHDLEAGVRLRPNSINELRELADSGVEIGAHTRSHPDLGASTDAGWLRDEIVGSIEDLERWTGRRPTSFAFPYGQVENLTPQAMAVARDAGITAICSAYGAYNRPETVSSVHGPLHLRRVHADPEWERFVNWMTFDARKLHAVDPIDDDAYLRDVTREAADAAPLLEAQDG